MEVIRGLDTKVNVKESFSSLKGELKGKIISKFKDILHHMANLEQFSGTAMDQKLLKDLVGTEVANIKNNLNTEFENKVRALIAMDYDRQKQKLNGVVFGTPQQPDDAQYVQKYLAIKYGMRNVGVLTVCHRTDPTLAHLVNSHHPPLIMFSVLNFPIKKAILQKSFEREGTMRFRKGVSKAYWEVR
ncbi:hypothetical protein QYM36_005777 [Artemia franciscana]|uniref:Uncharacterized protein n=1 Tax=Artemia franciscana TaxID=6661 RepID=A0AA88LAT2_ARTSF|nr:hypothetical protein QYM36_005777 [Artemia franciscana]